ncbi:MAG: tetratricopeptide repeat protein [Bdellovibrionales bacterium]|jgi:tetratricopeptide (TPR) repeat protein|nr:tetratricopeptide repeat protein [Bdellovibrionales bacterium]
MQRAATKLTLSNFTASSLGAGALAVVVLGLVLTTITGCSTATREENKTKASLHVQIGTTLFSNKKYPEALSEFLQAEKLDPENATVHNNLALTYFVRDRYDLSEKHIDRAIALDPKYTEARNNRARILIERKRYDEALEEAKRVIADLTYQHPIRGWINIALAHFRKGDFQQAAKSATDALKAERSNCFAQTILGRSLLEMGRLKQAALTLDRAIVACKAEGDDEAAYFSGFVHYKLGRSAAAVARLEAVIKEYPNGQYAERAASLLEIIK